MHLREATEAEKRARDEVTHAAWGAGLTRAQFLEREQVLRAHRWCRDVMTTWLWCDGDGRVLSSCETFRLPSHVGSAAGFAWSVASVFTEPALRGHGHAEAMMRALVARLRAEPRAQASVLFSEVGATLYERVGYRAFPGVDVVLPPLDAPADAAVRPLHAPLPPPPPVAAPPGTLVVVPTADEVDWHLERERFYTRAQGRRPLDVHGAALDGSSAQWTAYWKTGELLVLWLHLVDDAHRAPLLRAAQRAAHAVGLARVRAWEATPLGELPGARRVPRDDELPMAAPFVEGLTAWAQVQRALWV